MTEKQYKKELLQILHEMMGMQVQHTVFGIGTIVGFEEKQCIVHYTLLPMDKRMSVDQFFKFNEPIDEELKDKIDAVRADYQLSKGKENAQECIVSIEKVEEVKEKNDDKKITFDDVIGLEDVKETIKRMIIYPFRYKEIYEAFKRDSGGGILLYGAPGTGKTMIAKAIANEIDAEFFSIKCSDIVSKWYGESEQKIKVLFDKAKKNERSIIFFDEFDSLGADRDNQGLHSNNRVVSELLTQIDGFDNNPNSTILLIASTNKPWNIDSALLRSGRFNKKIYVGLPGLEARKSLLEHELSGVPSKALNLDEIAVQTDGYSSADIVELCNESKDIAIAKSIDKGKIVPITNRDISKSIEKVKSTVAKNELSKLENFKL